MCNITQNDFDEIAVKIQTMKVVITVLLRDDKKLKDAAVNIIAYVWKQYNIE